MKTPAILFLLTLAGWCARTGLAEFDQEEILRLVRERGLPIDACLARERAAEAALRTADPGARLVSAEEAEARARAESIDEAEEWPDDICYLKVGGLHAGGGHRIVGQARMWEQSERSGLIIDLRGAEGDDLESVYEIVGAFAPREDRLAPGLVGIMEVGPTGRTSFAVSDRIETPTQDVLTVSMPLLLLTDAATAGASEVLAAVLKDHGGVMVVGTPTSGTGTLREFIPLSDTHTVYLSTRWITTDLSVTNQPVFSGVDPDILVKAPERHSYGSPPPVKRVDDKPFKKTEMYRDLMQRVSGDAVLVRAVDILLGLKALDVYGASTNLTDSTGQPE